MKRVGRETLHVYRAIAYPSPEPAEMRSCCTVGIVTRTCQSYPIQRRISFFAVNDRVEVD